MDEIDQYIVRLGIAADLNDRLKGKGAPTPTPEGEEKSTPQPGRTSALQTPKKLAKFPVPRGPGGMMG